MANNKKQLGQFINYILGNGAPAPYMGLDIRGRLQDELNNFAQRILPQAPGMQRELFQGLDESDPGTWRLVEQLYYGR